LKISSHPEDQSCRNSLVQHKAAVLFPGRSSLSVLTSETNRFVLRDTFLCGTTLKCHRRYPCPRRDKAMVVVHVAMGL
jgi:hypothetical protein